MAIDTVAKRASVVGVGRPWLRSIWPDAVKGFDWRNAVGNIYSGVEPGAVIPMTGSGAVQANFAAVYGVGVATPVVIPAETPQLAQTLDSIVNVDLANVPNIADQQTYEAVLQVHEAIEIFLREQDATNEALDARLTVLEP